MDPVSLADLSIDKRTWPLDRVYTASMHFVVLQGMILNVAEIESIVDRPGSTSTLTFRGGRTIEIPDSTAKQIAGLLQKNTMILS